MPAQVATTADLEALAQEITALRRELEALRAQVQAPPAPLRPAQGRGAGAGQVRELPPGPVPGLGGVGGLGEEAGCKQSKQQHSY